MKLQLRKTSFYVVKKGQTIEDISLAFGVPPALLARKNGVRGEAAAGQVLLLPDKKNFCTLKGGESKSLFCGSPEAFDETNGASAFYPGMRAYFS